MATRLNIRHLVSLAVMCAAVAGVVTTAGYAAKSARLTGDSLAPANFSTLASSSTALSTVPSLAAKFSANWGIPAPSAGSVHALGGGDVFAWVHNGEVCWYGGYESVTTGYGVGGCASPTTPSPIGMIIGEVGGTKQSVVQGLAADGVESVTVTLDNGQTKTVDPVSNFYTVVLPSGVLPWDVTKVEATLAGGDSYTKAISIPAPAKISGASHTVRKA